MICFSFSLFLVAGAVDVFNYLMEHLRAHIEQIPLYEEKAGGRTIRFVIMCDEYAYAQLEASDLPCDNVHFFLWEEMYLNKFPNGMMKEQLRVGDKFFAVMMRYFVPDIHKRKGMQIDDWIYFFVDVNDMVTPEGMEFFVRGSCKEIQVFVDKTLNTCFVLGGGVCVPGSKAVEFQDCLNEIMQNVQSKLTVAKERRMSMRQQINLVYSYFSTEYSLDTKDLIKVLDQGIVTAVLIGLRVNFASDDVGTELVYERGSPTSGESWYSKKGTKRFLAALLPAEGTTSRKK
jgi:hypothetical protein